MLFFLNHKNQDPKIVLLNAFLMTADFLKPIGKLNRLPFVLGDKTGRLSIMNKTFFGISAVLATISIVALAQSVPPPVKNDSSTLVPAQTAQLAKSDHTITTLTPIHNQQPSLAMDKGVTFEVNDVASLERTAAVSQRALELHKRGLDIKSALAKATQQIDEDQAVGVLYQPIRHEPEDRPLSISALRSNDLQSHGTKFDPSKVDIGFQVYRQEKARRVAWEEKKRKILYWAIHERRQNQQFGGLPDVREVHDTGMNADERAYALEAEYDNWMDGAADREEEAEYADYMRRRSVINGPDYFQAGIDALKGKANKDAEDDKMLHPPHPSPSPTPTLKPSDPDMKGGKPDRFGIPRNPSNSPGGGVRG